MKSVLQENKECFICGQTYELHLHHIIDGPFRKKSEKYGLTVWLCPYHHNMSDQGVHFCRALDLALRREAQKAFEKTHSREEWMDAFEKNYL